MEMVSYSGSHGYSCMYSFFRHRAVRMELSRGSGHFRECSWASPSMERNSHAVQLCDVGYMGQGGYEAHMPHCGSVAPTCPLWEVDSQAWSKMPEVVKAA